MYDCFMTQGRVGGSRTAACPLALYMDAALIVQNKVAPCGNWSYSFSLSRKWGHCRKRGYRETAGVRFPRSRDAVNRAKI